MSVQHLVSIWLILWLDNKFAIVAESVSLAKPGCQQKCGEITIPFPFGIGRVGMSSNININRCYLDGWFEIECRNNSMSTGRPFLKRLNLEVLNISVPHADYSSENWVEVNSPIIRSSNCNRSSVEDHVDMTESGFIFSSRWNSFAAVGCNNGALMSNTDHTGFTGCTSDCSGAGCNTDIPSKLQILNVTFDRSKQECQHAFIAENQWLLNHQQRSPSFLTTVQDLDYAPAILHWGIPGYTPEGQRLWREASRYPDHTIFCDEEDGSRSNLQCRCRHGFAGNPYLPGGCLDINECEDPDKNWCQDDSLTCINYKGSFRCEGGKRRIKIITTVLGSSLGLLILIIVVCWLYKVFKRRQKIELKKKFFKRNGGLLLEQQISSTQVNVETTKVFTSKELEKATENFNSNRILGQGGQGTVYKGMLSNGKIVAVKKSKVEDEGLEQFINEVVILSQINHRNVVKLLGCCLETEVPLLVYEFIPNGNLFQYLHDQDEEFSVSWQMRLQIATEVAGAVSYLHSAASIPIYHRDIKSTNILLDEKYRAKVSDFGTSRSISIDQTHLTTIVHGTFGYLDPEYFQSSQFTDKSDVYSFGVVLAELLTGQTPISSLRLEEGRSLATYFLISMKENLLFDILDPQVKQQGREDDVVAVANLAKRCLNLNGRKRPTMREVATELERIKTSQIAVNGNANYEEIECFMSQESAPWDPTTTPTGSEMQIQLSSSADAQPLLPSSSW